MHTNTTSFSRPVNLKLFVHHRHLTKSHQPAQGSRFKSHMTIHNRAVIWAESLPVTDTGRGKLMGEWVRGRQESKCQWTKGRY